MSPNTNKVKWSNTVQKEESYFCVILLNLKNCRVYEMLFL